MHTNWINTCRSNLYCLFTVISVSGLVGCASSVDKVANKDAPTMAQIYDAYTGGVSQEKLEARRQALHQRPPVEECDLQLGLPPYPEQLDHLYPRIPNPDLFMYVRPHTVGETGAPIPAYITRFTMYERQPYALPGETLKTVQSPHGRSPACHPLSVNTALPTEGERHE